jgi:hypothetical protein
MVLQRYRWCLAGLWKSWRSRCQQKWPSMWSEAINGIRGMIIYTFINTAMPASQDPRGPFSRLNRTVALPSCVTMRLPPMHEEIVVCCCCFKVLSGCPGMRTMIQERHGNGQNSSPAAGGGPLQCVNMSPRVARQGGGCLSETQQSSTQAPKLWIAGSPGKPLIRRGNGRAGGDKERVSPDIRTSNFSPRGTKHHQDNCHSQLSSWYEKLSIASSCSGLHTGARTLLTFITATVLFRSASHLGP